MAIYPVGSAMQLLKNRSQTNSLFWLCKCYEFNDESLDTAIAQLVWGVTVKVKSDCYQHDFGSWSQRSFLFLFLLIFFGAAFSIFSFTLNYTLVN